MRTYTAHLKNNQEPIVLPEGWTWGGFLFGPLWLFSTRAWIAALLEIAVTAILAALAAPILPAALLGLAILNGLLGRDLVRWSLERRGYTLDHVVLAPNHDAALLRLFAARPSLTDPVR